MGELKRVGTLLAVQGASRGACCLIGVAMLLVAACRSGESIVTTEGSVGSGNPPAQIAPRDQVSESTTGRHADSGDTVPRPPLSSRPRLPREQAQQTDDGTEVLTPAIGGALASPLSSQQIPTEPALPDVLDYWGVFSPTTGDPPGVGNRPESAGSDLDDGRDRSSVDTSGNPTMEELIAGLRSDLTELHRNTFDASTPVGALCWSLWEAMRAYNQAVYGEAFLASLVMFEAMEAGKEVLLDEETGDVTIEGKVLTAGSVGITTEYPEFPNDYSIVESLEVVGQGPIRQRASGDALPSAYKRLADEFFAVIDEQRSLTDPEGFDIYAFDADYFASGGGETLDCTEHEASEYEESSGQAATEDPSPPVPADEEQPVVDEDFGDGDDGDTESADDDGDTGSVDDESNPPATPTTTTTTTATSATTTTTTTVPTPDPVEGAPPTADDGAAGDGEQGESEGGDGEANPTPSDDATGDNDEQAQTDAE